MFTSREGVSVLTIFLWDVQTYKIRPKLDLGKGGNRKLLLNGYGDSVWEGEKVPEVDGGDSYPTL